MRVFELIQALFDFLHLTDVFDRTLFAGGNDQPLLTLH